MSLQKAYKDWWEGPVGRDFHEFLQEVIELNRDLLEGTKVEEGSNDDKVKGRLANMRQVLEYINIMVNGLDEVAKAPEGIDDDNVNDSTDSPK
jgi:hypothetical protein